MKGEREILVNICFVFSMDRRKNCCYLLREIRRGKSIVGGII